MPGVIKRQLFSRVNRFQKPIITIVVATSFTMVILAVCVDYLFFDTTNIIIDLNKDISSLKMAALFILQMLPLLFYLFIVWAYKVSNRLVGPFERILRELDSIIEGKEKRHLHVRKGDELAEELLKRINVLIDKTP